VPSTDAHVMRAFIKRSGNFSLPGGARLPGSYARAFTHKAPQKMPPSRGHSRRDAPEPARTPKLSRRAAPQVLRRVIARERALLRLPFWLDGLGGAANDAGRAGGGRAALPVLDRRACCRCITAGSRLMIACYRLRKGRTADVVGDWQVGACPGAAGRRGWDQASNNKTTPG
jgi:hypothetical protein